LVQTRKIKPDITSIKRAIKYNLIDSTIALNAAFLVNTAILILAATVFFTSGNTHVARIQDAHRLLQPLLGSKLAPIIFAVALIAAGQSSTITGTLAGQIVMEGYLKLRINPWLRRLLTRLVAIIPTVFTILIYGDDKIDALLVLSQVILSVQLGFAVIPLIHFVSDKQTMGVFAIKPLTKIVSWLVAVLLLYLNTKMVIEQSFVVFNEPGMWFWKVIIIIASLLFIVLLLITTFLPLLQKQHRKQSFRMHSEIPSLQNLIINHSQKIAIALDFSLNDEKLIAYAISQGQNEATYVLLHIVESVSARFLGEESDDDETRNDMQQLEDFAAQLQGLGYKIEIELGYRNRIKGIVKIVNKSGADMLVMGAHRHTGIKDYLFGETIESVRHELKIPVLIVNL
jgi:manganese transport protein